MAAPDRTHYDVLGIARDADASAVRTAWKLHVQAWHPDRFNGEMREHAEQQTSRINEAYNTLRDASRRAAYDCRLAADEQAARPAPAPRRTPRMQAAPHRHAATPIGTPMAQPVPLTAGEQASLIVGDALAIVRRHPRVFAAAATFLVLVFGGSAVLSIVAGPSLPTGAATSAAAAPASAIVASEEQVADLEDLAERARQEAAAADAELEQLMRADALAAQQAAQQAARDAALAAKAARTARPAASRSGTAAGRAGKRIVRVMPTNRPTI